MSKSAYSKLKPYRIHVLYFFIIWYTPTYLDEIFGKYGGLVGGALQLLVFFMAALFLMGSFLKSKNGFAFGLCLFMIFLSIIRFIAVMNIEWRGRYIIDPMGMYIFIISLIAILMTTHKFSSGFIWYRHLPLFLDLAAKPVMAASNGYTNRPFPVGKSQYSKEEIIRFAEYLHRKLIATSYIKDDRVVLVFSNGLFQYIPFIKPDFNRLTYIAFGYGGDISVNFAKRDYKKYWDEITFDQLCNSFGNIMIDFFNAFKKGEGGTFFRRLNKEGLEIGQPELNPYSNSNDKAGTLKKNKINYGWVFLSGLLAFFVIITVEAVVEGTYGFLFDRQWVAVWQDITSEWGSWEKLLNILIAVVQMVLFMWIYAALIPRYGASKKNVLMTSLIVLALFSSFVLNMGNLGFLGAIPNRMWLLNVIFSIIEIPIAIFVGAWLYRED
jgi:hypothetical protein